MWTNITGSVHPRQAVPLFSKIGWSGSGGGIGAADSLIAWLREPPCVHTRVRCSRSAFAITHLRHKPRRKLWKLSASAKYKNPWEKIF